MENKEELDLAKWLAGDMSEAELAAFEKSPGYDTYAKIKKYSAQLEAPAFDERKLYSDIVEYNEPTRKVVPLYKTVFRIAAVLVIALGIGLAARTFMSVSEVAQNGELVSFQLPDQSEVVLNAGSEVGYKKWNWSNNRSLDLDGEAYFKVAKGKKFEVKTALGKVAVLGTQFTVKSRKDRFDVACYEGRVKVSYQDTEVIITKGQSVAFGNGNAIEVPQNNTIGPSWINNKLTFNKETLSNIVDELGRQYDVAIELKANASNQLFTGVLPMKNLDEALQIISSTYHLRPINQNGKIILQAL